MIPNLSVLWYYGSDKEIFSITHWWLFSGLHEEVDYSEKLKFSDDEDDHGPSDKNKMWWELFL